MTLKVRYSVQQLDSPMKNEDSNGKKRPL